MRGPVRNRDLSGVISEAILCGNCQPVASRRYCRQGEYPAVIRHCILFAGMIQPLDADLYVGDQRSGWIRDLARDCSLSEAEATARSEGDQCIKKKQILL